IKDLIKLSFVISYGDGTVVVWLANHISLSVFSSICLTFSNAALKSASVGRMNGILNFENEPKVSIDYNHTTTSSNYAQPQTTVTKGGLVRVVSWYDNEWGFSNRMIDTAKVMANL
ncbi:MAG: hypothetical protein P8M01_06505, partial [Amylibacter sp.]|nr:hypothetical protein [Amylibacter sp.]